VHGHVPDDSLRHFFRAHCADLPQLIDVVVRVAQTLEERRQQRCRRAGVGAALHEANGILVVSVPCELCSIKRAPRACDLGFLQEIAMQARGSVPSRAQSCMGLTHDAPQHFWLGKCSSPCPLSLLVLHCFVVEPVIDALNHFLNASIQTIEHFAPAQVLEQIRKRRARQGADMVMDEMPGGVDEAAKALVPSLIDQASELAKHLLLSHRERLAVSKRSASSDSRCGCTIAAASYGIKRFKKM